jgi:hypothetical protein
MKYGSRTIPLLAGSQSPLDLSDLFLMSKIDKKTGGKRGELNKGMILESFCELVLNSL